MFLQKALILILFASLVETVGIIWHNESVLSLFFDTITHGC